MKLGTRNWWLGLRGEGSAALVAKLAPERIDSCTRRTGEFQLSAALIAELGSVLVVMSAVGTVHESSPN